MIGEIIAGILLGPSGLGQSHPCPTGNNAHGSPCDPANPTLLLFPTHTPFWNGPSNIRKCACAARFSPPACSRSRPACGSYLNVLAQLGVVTFMFVVGAPFVRGCAFRCWRAVLCS